MIIFISLLICSAVSAQDTALRPTRTAEEEAQKQTARLERELDLDSIQRDTIYKVNLQFTQERRAAGSNRTNAIRRAQRYNEILQGILTEEQFSHFMQLQHDENPRQQQMTRVVVKPDAEKQDSVPKRIVNDGLQLVP